MVYNNVSMAEVNTYTGIKPDRDTFKALAGKGKNLVPVYAEILGDTITPVAAYLKFSRVAGPRHGLPNSFLFESVLGGEKWARYSFLGFDPSAVITSRGNMIEVAENGQVTKIEAADPLKFIEEYMSRFRPAESEDKHLPRFYGGLVGYIGYEMVRFMEKLPSSARRPSGTDALPDMFLMLADTLLVFDNLTQGIKVLVNVHMSDGADADKAYGDAVLKINGIIQRLLAQGAEGPVPAAISIPRRNPAMKSGSALSGNEFTSSFGKKEEFMDAVDKAKEYIKAGDALQVVLSQRFEKKTQADPFDIYRALRVINPSPYMYYLDSGDAKLVGSSPEILVRLEGPEITVRPIAGTRRRGRDEAEDKALEAEMKADPKEIAEHVMLLDLGRNDIGRVSATGSVKPAQIMTTERYSHVMHMVSTVTGTLREGLSGMDVLRAAFPAGTVTGAPKVRAMEIIEELEPVRRGPYAGAVGYLSYSGNLDTCITIRTLIIKEGVVYVQAGAGLVADSVPDLEYKETVNKAMAMMEAVKAAEKNFSGGQQPPKR